MIKKAAVIALLAACGWRAYQQYQGYPDTPQPLQAQPNSYCDDAALVDVTNDLRDIRPVPGRSNVCVFYNPQQVSGQQIAANLIDFHVLRPDVWIFKVRMDLENPNDAARWAGPYAIERLPHVRIYDADGKIVAADKGTDSVGYDALLAWIATERSKAGR